MVASLGLAFLAGALSVLSPCVLPILPIVLGAATTQHRLGPAALAGGLALSFVAIGLFFATIGFSLGLDSGVLREIAAVVLMAIGLVLVLPPLQARLAVAAGPVGQWTDERFGGFSRRGLQGQFGLGLLLGASGAPASVRRSAPPQRWPPKVTTSSRSRPPCWCSGSGPPCRSSCSGPCRETSSWAGAAACWRPALR